MFCADFPHRKFASNMSAFGPVMGRRSSPNRGRSSAIRDVRRRVQFSLPLAGGIAGNISNVGRVLNGNGISTQRFAADNGHKLQQDQLLLKRFSQVRIRQQSVTTTTTTNGISGGCNGCEKPPAPLPQPIRVRSRAAVLKTSPSPCCGPPKHRFRDIGVPIAVSPAVRIRVPPTFQYIAGALSPTAASGPPACAPASPDQQALLRVARDADDPAQLRQLLRAALVSGCLSPDDLNAADNSGRTLLSYVASHGVLDLLELLLQIGTPDPNKADNEGNTPLHFIAQAGHVECLNTILSRCRGIDVDAKNNLGFTPLMKAALQGRCKCAKMLLFAGADPMLRDNGRAFRADQWARFCGRYICADTIEKHSRRCLDKHFLSSHLRQKDSHTIISEPNEKAARALISSKIVPMQTTVTTNSHGLKSKLKKVFTGSTGRSNDFSTARIVSQLTSAVLCASTPILPTSAVVPPSAKSILRPLTVPKVQVTLASNSSSIISGSSKPDHVTSPDSTVISDEKYASSKEFPTHDSHEYIHKTVKTN